MRILTALIAATTLTACSHHYDDATDKAAENALNAWIAAVESKDVNRVVKLYDDDAVLLATFGAKPILTQEARAEYFKNKIFVYKDLKVKVNELHTERDGDIALANGLYTFSFKQGGQTVKVPARFSFVFEEETEGWEIEAHHSSVVPREASKSRK